MQMYVNYYTREMMNEGDTQPIGIVLCADKGDSIVKYTLPEDDHQIFASKYFTYLPSEEEGGIICGVQLIPLIGSILPTEIALKKNFDKNFMLIMDLLLPFTMIGFGRYFMKKAPKEINSVFGYRTSMSMKNKDTWEFAHKYCGKVWYVCGMVMLPITVIFMLLVIGKNEDCVGSMGGIICGVQLIPLIGLIGSILPTEIALKKNFDKNGTRR